MEIAGLSLGLAMGVDPRRLLFLAAGLYFPILIVALAAYATFRVRRASSSTPAFCDAVSAELRAGSSMHGAIRTAGASVGGPVFRAPEIRDASWTELAALVGDEFADAGTELQLVIQSAASSGSSAADLFDEIGSLALADVEIEHEVRVATSLAKATALVFLVVPAFALFGRRNELGGLMANPSQRGAIVLGVVLFALGLISVITMLARSR